MPLRLFSQILIAIRVLLTAMGAGALLYTFSYPYSIIPPNPAWSYAEGLTPEDFRPWIWVAPWLWMELVSSLGGKRNVVWFSGLGAVLVGAFLAWPVLKAYYPELVYPTFSFEDGKLSEGFMWLCIFAFGSVLFRGVLLSFLFMKPRETDENDANYADADQLNPETARTVREIAANPVRVQPKFLFGDADMGLISRFRKLMSKLARVRAWKWSLLFLAVTLAFGWFFFFPQPTEREAFHRDLDRMYQIRGCVARGSLPDSAPVRKDAKGVFLATTPAVHAAYRVMKRISDHESFAGMNRRDAEAWLGLDRAPIPKLYRGQLRDESDITLPSVDDIFDSRTRFLTVTDGRRTAVLYVRFGSDDETINIAEVQDAGWNARADERRRRFGTDVDSKLLN